MSGETVLSNAKLVLEDSVVAGSVLLREGRIADIGDPSAKGEDLAGDYLVPGLVELHTDHLESHFSPRPGVQWDALPAVLAHDAQMSAAGVTTVFDAVRIGSTPDGSDGAAAAARRLALAVESAVETGLLRADHEIHLRCEVSSADCFEMFESFADDAYVKLASLMDHTPGQRQYADVAYFKRHYLGTKNVAPADMDRYIEQSRELSATHADVNRRMIAKNAAERGISLAAHDDATLEHVQESVGLGVRIAEFPTTVVAARASVEAGLLVVMGAPNVVCGGSQSGNVAASQLLSLGLLDILSSDYVPASLLQAVFQLAADGACPLPEGMKLVSANPARAVGLADRGSIAVGQRADLVRVHEYVMPGNDQHPNGVNVPVVRGVYRQGKRVS